MKKYAEKIALILILVFILVLPVSAEKGMDPASGTDTVGSEVVSEETTDITETGGIPEARLLPRLVDNTDLLTDAEKEALLKQLDEISERQQCDVVIVVVNSLGGKNEEAYADDYYDYNGYGFGEDADGLLLLVSMDERKWAISTCGYGVTAFTDAGQTYLIHKFKPLLSSGDYAAAFTVFAEMSDEFITQAKKGEPYDIDNIPRGTVSPFWIFGDLLIGFVIALLWGLRKKAKLKSVRKKASANDYTKPGSIQLTINHDHLVNVTTTSRSISSSSDSSGGGSGTHTSSSGRRHGGSSGGF